MTDSKFTVHFKGTITALDPLQVSLPGAYKEKRGMTERTYMPRMGSLFKVPHSGNLYFPARSIKGRLRSMGLRVANAKQGAFDLETIIYLQSGGIMGKNTGTEKESYDPQITLKYRDRNPQIGLFGSGSEMSMGRLSVSNAIAHNKEGQEGPLVPAIISGVRTNPFIRNKDMFHEMSDETLSQYEDRMRADHKNSRLKRELSILQDKDNPKYNSSLGKPERDALIEAKKEEINENLSHMLGHGVGLQQILPEYEAIPAGAELNFDMTLVRASKMEVGYLMAILEELSMEPFLGGLRNIGCGKFSMNLEVKIIEERTESQVSGNRRTTLPREELSLQPFDLVIHGDFLKEALEMWNAADVTGFDFSQPVKITKKARDGQENDGAPEEEDAQEEDAQEEDAGEEDEEMATA